MANLNNMADMLTDTSANHTEWSGRMHAVGTVISGLAIGLFSANLISEGVASELAVFGSIFVGYGLWLSRRALRVNLQARFLRRRTLLANSLGYGEALIEGLELAADNLGDQRLWIANAADRPGYYSSTAQSGMMRLRENLRESAFWTEKLYRLAKGNSTLKAAFALVLAIGMAAAIVFLRKGALNTATVLQLVSIALIFIATADQMDAAQKWGWASVEARRIRQGISAQEATLDDQMIAVRTWVAFADYAVLTSIAPAIPNRLYKRYGPKLTTLSANILYPERTGESEVK